MTIGGNPVSPARSRLAELNWQNFLMSGALIVSWILLNGSALTWLGRAVQEAARFNLLMVGMGGIVLAVVGLRQRRVLHWTIAPTLHRLPVALMIGSAVVAIVLRWWLALDHLAVMLFLTGTYGLIGLFLHPAVWRRGLALAIAIACLLPFGMQFGSGLGFPIRILTAHLVEHLLTTLHLSALSSEHIIVLENRIASVDLPCSGVKSLWTGTLFLLLATWLEGRSLGLRWLVVFLTNTALLILANVGRVLTLVLLAQQPALAELLHVPLGLFGFVTASLISLWLLRSLPCQTPVRLMLTAEALNLLEPVQMARSSHRRILQGVLVVTLVGLALIPQPPSLTIAPPNLATLPLPETIHTTTLPLTPVEQEFFGDYPGTIARKTQFAMGEVSGSWLLVYAPTWRAHHAPELCLQGNGYQVSHMDAQALTPDIAGRWLSLNQGQQSAAYWFQSSRRTTGDFLTRLWGEVTRQEPAWVMVSVLFDQPYTHQEPAIQELLNTIYHTIAHSLPGGDS